MSLVDTETTASLITPLFEVRQSPIQGKGAFATQDIHKGQRIIEYVGERISDAEADRRYDETTMERHHTFLFTLDEETVIDGAVGGNASIYINHSCDPNCEAVIEDDRIYIYSLRPISAEEELLYDYQYEREDDEALISFYRCLCGSEKCRGTIMKPAKEAKSKTRKAGGKKGGKKAVAKNGKKGVKAAGKSGGSSALAKGSKGAGKVAKGTKAKAGAKGVKGVKGAKKSAASAKKAAKKAVKTSPKRMTKKAAKTGSRLPKRGVKAAAKKSVKTAAKKSATRSKAAGRGKQSRVKTVAKRSASAPQRSSRPARKQGATKKGGTRTKRTRTVR